MDIEIGDINWWSVIGLVIDIIGVAIIFFNGLPGYIYSNQSSLTMFDAYENKRIDKKRKWSKAGFVIVIVGFILQLIGTLTNVIII